VSTWYETATALIAPFEGCQILRGDKVYPYFDTLAKPPLWTRGYGMTTGISESTKPISKQDAYAELVAATQAYGLRVANLAPMLLEHPLAHAACTSWSYNCGLGAFKASRLRRALNDGRLADACDLITKPNTAGGVVYKGLQRRRQAEATLMRQAFFS